ncbi:MAG: S8 family serine peptidase [Thermoflexibacter sp.]|nr:S8 family serine peptidase [Thermoflexibacter sp.]
MRYYLIFLLWLGGNLLLSHSAFTQNRSYLIRFTNKNGSPFSVNRPQEFLTQRAIDRRTKQNIKILERDLPVNANYVQQVRQTGARVLYTTRWMNGVVIEADQATLDRVNRLSFVQNTNIFRLNLMADLPEEPKVEVSQETIPSPISFPSGRVEEDYGTALPQTQMLGIDEMHKDGFRGEGIVIAVIDNGFQNANTNPLFSQMKVLGSFNFVRNSLNVYNVSGTHGARVLSLLGAKQDGVLVGTAPNASYYLFVTEIDERENRAEEAYWLVAAERADSLGVDIISTSLGYTTFDDRTLNYTTNDLNGRTALVSQAAAIAVQTGMIVVKSAGNQGLSSWQKVSFPGDVDSVLTVGAVDINGIYDARSGRGRTADGRIKPDVVALGLNTVVGFPSGSISISTGTSFAAPQVAGLAAGLWQANPSMTNMQIVNIIRRSGNRFNNPSDSVGYGIPSYVRAKILATEEENLESTSEHIVVFPNPVVANQLQIRFGYEHLGKEFAVKLFDVSGRLCLSGQIQFNNPIMNTYQLLDMSKEDLAGGIYLLHIETQGFKKVVKISK